MAGSLTLKWGTAKAWHGLEGDAADAMEEFIGLGRSPSAMAQEMTPAHKDALCKVIDAVDEPIFHDWSGEEMTRDEAKKYVREYR